MASVNVQGVTYGVEDRRGGERVVTCRRGVGGQLLSSVVLPPDALPTIAEAFGAGESGELTAEHPAVRELVQTAVAEEHERGVAALDQEKQAHAETVVRFEALVAEHEEAGRTLAARVAELEAGAAAPASEPKLEVAKPDGEVVPIEKARAAKESKPEKSTTRRRPAPAKK